MTLTALLLNAIYEPISALVAPQGRYITDYLCHDYYHSEAAYAYMAPSNASDICSGRRLLPMPVCRHYLDRQRALQDDIRYRIVPKYVDQHCLQSVVDNIYDIIHQSDIYPMDIAYLDSYYSVDTTCDGAAQYIAAVIWYVMQTEDKIDRNAAA